MELRDMPESPAYHFYISEAKSRLRKRAETAREI